MSQEQRYFRIQSWGKYQHYNKPRPPWIKLFTKINDPDNTWRGLSDAEVGQLIRVMVFAALNDNTLPFDPQIIKDMTGISGEIDLKKLVKLGIIEVFNSHKKCLVKEKSRIKSRLESRPQTRPQTKVPSSEVRDQRRKNLSQNTLTGAESRRPRTAGSVATDLVNDLAARRQGGAS